MRHMGPGWATDLAVMEYAGSVVEDRGDHLVVRTAANPTYHWGNCLFVLDPAMVDDAPGWAAAFQRALPHATWVAIGLPGTEIDPGPWDALGIRLSAEDVLTASRPPRRTPRPDDYTVRALDGDDDWAQYLAKALAEDAREKGNDPVAFEPFARAMARSRRDLCARGLASWFGAFSEDALVADLGIVLCGTRARYQAVGTEPDHRRRGLAAHLLGEAAVWAAEHGCDEWVIVTEATNEAGRVYRAAGFEPVPPNTEAYRVPPGVAG